MNLNGKNSLTGVDGYTSAKTPSELVKNRLEVELPVRYLIVRIDCVRVKVKNKSVSNR